MKNRVVIMLKRVLTFLLLFIFLLVGLSQTEPLRVEAAVSEINSSKTLLVTHAKEGALETEITAAIKNSGIKETEIQLLTLSGNTVLNAADWNTLRNKTGLSSLSALYFSGYKAETSVPEEALANITWITDLKISDSFSEIGRSAFENCRNLKEIELLGVKTIGARAFFSTTSLSKAYLQDVTLIRESAFNGANVLTGGFFEKVEVIESWAFTNTALKQISLPSLKELKTSGFENATELLSFYGPNLVTLGERAFASCSKLTQIVFGEDASVGNSTFLMAKGDPLVLYKGYKPLNLPSGATAVQYEGSIEMPKSQLVSEGANVSLSAKLTPKTGGDYTLSSYQWFKNGSAITEGSSNNYINITSVTQSDVGNYQVSIKLFSNVAGANPSEVTFTSVPAAISIKTVQVDTITGLPAQYTMKTGEKVSWNPKPSSGSWDYDKTGFQIKSLTDGVEFTAQKKGSYTISYTISSGKTHKITVTVSDASSSSSSSSSSTSSSKPGIPGTGQGTVYFVLAGSFVIATSVGLYVSLRKKK